jgi:hypothetical protein
VELFGDECVEAFIGSVAYPWVETSYLTLFQSSLPFQSLKVSYPDHFPYQIVVFLPHAKSNIDPAKFF